MEEKRERGEREINLDQEAERAIGAGGGGDKVHLKSWEEAAMAVVHRERWEEMGKVARA